MSTFISIGELMHITLLTHWDQSRSILARRTNRHRDVNTNGSAARNTNHNHAKKIYIIIMWWLLPTMISEIYGGGSPIYTVTKYIIYSVLDAMLYTEDMS